MNEKTIHGIASKGRANYKQSALAGFSSGLLLEFIALTFTGIGAGTYVPILLVSGPVAMSYVGYLLGGPMLFLCYSLIITHWRNKYHGFIAAILVMTFHYGLTIIVAYTMWNNFALSSEPGAIKAVWSTNAASLLVFAALYLALITYTIYYSKPSDLRLYSRMKHGLCMVCSYNLRGDYPGGCPECGWGRRVALPPKKMYSE